VESHADVGVIYTEHSRISVTERNYGRVEDTVRVEEKVTRNNGVS
jgi:hypothetical protein